jgi:hypothetical protein
MIARSSRQNAQERAHKLYSSSELEKILRSLLITAIALRTPVPGILSAGDVRAVMSEQKRSLHSSRKAIGKPLMIYADGIFYELPQRLPRI